MHMSSGELMATISMLAGCFRLLSYDILDSTVCLAECVNIGGLQLVRCQQTAVSHGE